MCVWGDLWPEAVPREEMEQGRTGKMDLGYGGDGSGDGAARVECGFTPWHSPSVLGWGGAGQSQPRSMAVLFPGQDCAGQVD